MDEPPAGLDPEERDRFHILLSQIGENITVILSTHIVSDVSDLCQEMAIINAGRVLLQAEPEAAVEALRGKVWKKIIEKSAVEEIAANRRLISSRFTHGRVLAKIYADSDPGEGFSEETPDLEDVYFSHIRAYATAR